MKVFISHSSRDKKFVRTLKDDLIENGIDTWMDEDELDYGDKLLEKLEFGLQYSSHFLIILSPNSVNSEWVKFELQKAFDLIGNSIQKIIPVLYRACDIPKKLEGQLYGDLTGDVVQVEGNRVKFVSQGYSPFLEKLIGTIKREERQLTHEDRKKLKENISEISSEETTEVHKSTDEIVSLYRTMGYMTQTAKEKAIQRVKNKRPDLNEVRPILLPNIFKFMGKKIEYGDEIPFTLNYKNQTYGHFAGFRHNNIAICLDKKTRELLGIRNKSEYAVEIRFKEVHIDFIEI